MRIPNRYHVLAGTKISRRYEELDELTVSIIFSFLPIINHPLAMNYFDVTIDATDDDRGRIGCFPRLGIINVNKYGAWKYRMHEVNRKNVTLVGAVYTHDDLYAIYHNLIGMTEKARDKISTLELTGRGYECGGIKTKCDVFYARAISIREKIFLISSDTILDAAMDLPYPHINKLYGTNIIFTGSKYYWLDPNPDIDFIGKEMRKHTSVPNFAKPSSALFRICYKHYRSDMGSLPAKFRPSFNDVCWFLDHSSATAATAMKILVSRTELSWLNMKYSRQPDKLRIIKHMQVKDIDMQGMIPIFFDDRAVSKKCYQ